MKVKVISDGPRFGFVEGSSPDALPQDGVTWTEVRGSEIVIDDPNPDEDWEMWRAIGPQGWYIVDPRVG